MKFKIEFSGRAYKDLTWWKKYRPEYLKKIRELLEAIKTDPFKGIGKPEPLKHGLHGLWSRHITEEHRVWYEVKGETVRVRRLYTHYE
jgi:toxin YoeB